MPFRFLRQARAVVTVLIASALLTLTACNRAASKEEKALRAELREALRGRSYEKAAALAQRVLKMKPQDEGTRDRLVQAQFGLRDFAAVKQSLEEWRHVVKKPSPNLEEYAGDLALEEHEPSAALRAWSKVLAADPKNIRVLEKIARLEQAQRHWPEENAAWTALIDSKDDATARINRALCRRRLHRWHEAFEDLQRAQALEPNNPEVQRAGKLFEQTGKFLGEIRELDAALAVTPNDPGLFADRALMFLRCEDFELALEDAEAAAKAGPWAMRPRLFQAMALIARGRSAECENLGVDRRIRLETLTPEFLETMGRLDSEISAERNNAELYVARAWQLNEIGQPTLALQDAEHGTQLDAKSANACAEASYALNKLGRGKEALDQIKHANDLDANFSTAWQYRGELEMERGETLSAIDSFSHALETNQTVVALQKREQCYRRLGLLVKAEQDRRALEELNARAAK
ncbi:MAG: Tetratricopeptide repeat [Verrucomicrobiota bacterium]|jgi:tetratricopeptide (TPR) repeat protein